MTQPEPEGITAKQGIARSMQRLRQVMVLVILAAVLGAWFFFDLGDWLSFEQLAERSQDARAALDARPVKITALFFVSLVLVTLFCIPAVAILQIFSGFLFGPLAGTLVSILAQTLGGALAFLIAGHTFRESFARLIGPYLGGLEAGFQANAFTYIVTLRMTPVMPYWVVNIAPSLLGVRFRPFVLGTLVGAIPLTFVYATFGAGLGEVIEAGGTPELADLLTPKAIGLVIVALLFALAPILLRRFMGRKINPRQEPLSAEEESPPIRDEPRR